MVSDEQEIRLSYLLSGSCEVLPSSYVKLRSYLNIHSARLAELYNFKIFKNRNVSCPYCYTTWTCGTSSFKLLPSKKLKLKFRKRNSEESDQKETADELRNKLVLKCRVCTRRSCFSLVKKKNVKEKVPKEEVNVKSVKKKKRKKDKSCGLLVNLEKTVTPVPSQPFALKKRPGSASEKDRHGEDPVELTQENTKKIQTKSLINLAKPKPITQSNQRLIVNPFSPQVQSKLSKNKHQKLKNLKNSIKGNKDVAKTTTLRDFLTLIK